MSLVDITSGGKCKEERLLDGRVRMDFTVNVYFGNDREAMQAPYTVFLDPQTRVMETDSFFPLVWRIDTQAKERGFYPSERALLALAIACKLDNVIYAERIAGIYDSQRIQTQATGERYLE